MKVIERYFPVVLFIMLFKVVLTFEPVDEMIAQNAYCSPDIYFQFKKAILSCDAAHCAVQSGCNFLVCG